MIFNNHCPYDLHVTGLNFKIFGHFLVDFSIHSGGSDGRITCHMSNMLNFV
jgi:hypothetical protein